MPNIAGYFSNVFGHSPFGDLQRHAALCVQAVEELENFFEANFSANWGEVEASYNLLTQLEQEADELKREIRTHLPTGFFLPVARTDLLDLLGTQDKIANVSRDIAGITLGRKLQFPSELNSDVKALVAQAVAACRMTGEIINRLDELIDTAFKGPQAKLVFDMIEKVEAFEHETDELVVTIRKKIFGMEEELPPVHVMFLYRVLDLLADLADESERVAHRVQLMLAK